MSEKTTNPEIVEEVQVTEEVKATKTSSSKSKPKTVKVAAEAEEKKVVRISPEAQAAAEAGAEEHAKDCCNGECDCDECPAPEFVVAETTKMKIKELKKQLRKENKEKAKDFVRRNKGKLIAGGSALGLAVVAAILAAMQSNKSASPVEASDNDENVDDIIDTAEDGVDTVNEY